MCGVAKLCLGTPHDVPCDKSLAQSAQCVGNCRLWPQGEVPLNAWVVERIGGLG